MATAAQEQFDQATGVLTLTDGRRLGYVAETRDGVAGFGQVKCGTPAAQATPADFCFDDASGEWQAIQREVAVDNNNAGNV